MAFTSIFHIDLLCMLRNFPLCNLHQIIFHFHIFILFFNIYGRIHEIYLKNLLLLRDVLFIMTCAEFPLNTCFYIKKNIILSLTPVSSLK
jgi:hypothetical protein